MEVTKTQQTYSHYLATADAARRKARGAQLAAHPELLLEELFSRKATLSTHAILNAIAEGVENQTQARQLCRSLDTMVREGKLIALQDDKGIRWTTPEMLRLERGIRSFVEGIASAKPLSPIDPSKAKQLGFDAGSPQERACERILLGQERLVPIEGHAGTGKSYVLKQAFELVKKHAPERKQIGLAQREATVLDLQQSTGIPSRTLQDFVQAVRSGKLTIDENTDLVLDEANLVGAREMHALLNIAHERGARLVLAGDTAQLPPIAAGSAFRMILDECRRTDAHGRQKLPVASFEKVRRQSGWHLEAATLARSGDTVSDALSLYAKNGNFHVSSKPSEAVKHTVDLWMKRNDLPHEQRLLIAFREDDVADLNAKVHDRRHKRGDFTKSMSVSTPQGYLTIGASHGPRGEDGDGERILFTEEMRLASSRGEAVRVPKGTRGTVRALENGRLRVLLDGPEKQEIVVDPTRHGHPTKGLPLAYGYAISSYDAEGLTSNYVAWYGTPKDFQASAYIALSRSRSGCDVGIAGEAFSSSPLTSADAWARKAGQAMSNEHATNIASRYRQHSKPISFSEHFSEVASRLRNPPKSGERRAGLFRFDQWMRGAGGSTVARNLRACASWREFHNVLAEHGISVKQSGKGKRLTYIDAANAQRRCKESLLPVDLHLTALEAKLGPFTMPTQEATRAKAPVIRGAMVGRLHRSNLPTRTLAHAGR